MTTTTQPLMDTESTALELSFVSDNLRPVFDAKAAKTQSPCCGAEEQAVCCEPAQKPVCCAPVETQPAGCGCR